MKKKLLLIPLALLLAISLVAIGCPAPAPAPAPTPAPAPAPTPAPVPAPAPTEHFRWRYQSYVTSPTEPTSAGQLEFTRRIFERSGGRLLIDLYLGGALGYSGFEHHRVCGQGFIEIGESGAVGAITEEPVFSVLNLPTIYKTLADVKKALELTRDDLDKAAARMNTKIIMAVSYPIDHWNTTKPLPTVDSFRGVKLRAWNPMLADWAEAMGAAPMVIPYAEKYTSLATGVVEGNASCSYSVVDTNDYEVAKYYNLWPLQPPVYISFVNLDAYNSLPPDLQDILMEESRKSEANQWEAMFQADKTGLDDCRAKGVTIIEPSAEELEKARKLVQGKIWEDWRAEAGPEASALLDRIMEILG